MPNQGRRSFKAGCWTTEEGTRSAWS